MHLFCGMGCGARPNEARFLPSAGHHPSPAYNLTWSTASFGEHSATVDGNGKNPGVKERVAVGRATGMGSKACRKIAGEIRERTRVPEKAFNDVRSKRWFNGPSVIRFSKHAVMIDGRKA